MLRPIVLGLLGTVAALHGGEAPDLRVGVRFFEERVKSDPQDFLAHNQLGERCLALARETGHAAWLARAARAAADSLRAVPERRNPGGLALQARVDLAEHRFAAAREAAERLRMRTAGRALPLQILADAQLELGALEAVPPLLLEMEGLEDHPANLAPRQARLALAQGRLDLARERFRAARDAAQELATPSPLTVAWCELQLGELAFRTGDWTEAEARYQAALAALPKWYAATEHLAELRGAQGRDTEALALYEEAIARAPRPELLQAVGDLHLFHGRKDEAKAWHDRALAAYRRATEQGSVAYFHHLAGFHCDSQPDPAEAVKWARRDLEIRQTAAARDALAWALYKSGDLAGAAEQSALALATGARDAHLLHHAGLIRLSAGDVAGGQAALREAAAINPSFQAFHAHR